MKKALKTCLTTFLAIIIILVLFASCGTSKENKNTIKDINSMTYIDAVKYIAEKELKNDGENLKITTSYYDGDNIMINYLVKSYWDGSDFVRKAFSHYVNVCKEAYTHKDAIEIYFNVDGVLIDSKGQEEVRTLIYLIMPIENFRTYNWENLKMRNLDFNQISQDCKIFNIKRPLINDFDESKFYYLG